MTVWSRASAGTTSSHVRELPATPWTSRRTGWAGSDSAMRKRTRWPWMVTSSTVMRRGMTGSVTHCYVMEAATAANETVETMTSGSDQEAPTFSLELNEDQKNIREWAHGFAENVIRPAAAEWDEREE